jgi:phosphocarrier protein HPr
MNRLGAGCGFSMTRSRVFSDLQVYLRLWEVFQMKSFSYVITDNEGIHARPAGELVKLCKQFQSAITISKGEKSGKATKILAVMSLGATKGSTVDFTIEGPDEDAACEAVEAFMKENL